jgi:hypothetical protein
MPWSALPTELVLDILGRRAALIRRETRARAVQAAWRGYRVRVLLGRFHMLRYLAEFRRHNPDVRAFVRRARL